MAWVEETGTKGWVVEEGGQWVEDAPDERAGLIKATVRDWETKVPFSPAAVVRTLERVGASKRLSKPEYELSYSKKYNIFKVLADKGIIPEVLSPKWDLEKQRQEDIKIMEDWFEELAEKDKGYTLAGQVGKILSDIPAYMIEFLATGGLQTLGKGVAKQAGARLLGKYATTTAGKAALATGGFAIGTAVRSAGMPHRAAESILKRQVPQDVQIDKEGNVNIIGPVESPATSIYKGLLDHYIEIASEQAGEFLAPSMSRYFKKLPFMGKFINKLEKTWIAKTGKTANDFRKAISSKVGFHGVLAEVGEEYIGDISRAITDVEDFGAGKDANIFERISAAVKQDTKSLPAMFIAFSVPGAAGRAAAVIKSKSISRDMKVEDILLDKWIDSTKNIGEKEQQKMFEGDLYAEEYPDSEYKFKKPGLGIYLGGTPKWLVNRMLGVENIVQDVDAAEMARNLEQTHLNSWINKIEHKIKRLNSLKRIPSLLPAQRTEKAEKFKPIKMKVYRAETGEPSLRPSKSFALNKEMAVPETIPGQIVPSYEVIESEVFLKNPLVIEGLQGNLLDKWAEEGDEKAKILVSEADYAETIPDDWYMRADTYIANTAASLGYDGIFYDTSSFKNMKQRSEIVVIDSKLVDEALLKAKLSNKITKNKPLYIMRDLLDTYEEAPNFLTKEEQNAFNQIRELTRYLRQRANLVREKQGLKPIADVKGYITHWMDKTAEQIIEKDLPIHSGYLYWLMKELPKKIDNPTAKKREVRGLMEKYFSKDLGKLLRIMTSYDLRDIHLLHPYQAVWDELQNLRKERLIPDSTYHQVENYLRYDIRKHKPLMDRAVNITLKKPADLINKLLPATKQISDPTRTVFGTLRRFGQLSGLGFRIKPPIRNLGQRLLLLDLYRGQDYAKAQAVAIGLAKMPEVKHPITGESISLIDLVREQDWYKISLRKFEDIYSAVTGIERASMYIYGKTHIGSLFLSNTEVSVLTGYFDWLNNFQKSQNKKSNHYKNCVIQSEKLVVPIEELITQESDMMWNIREAVRRTQWEYMSISMPTFFRGDFNRGMGIFQSWWMNYFFNHCRECTNQIITGRNSKGRLLTPHARLRAFKGMGTIVAIGRVAETLFGIQMLKYLFMPLPGYLPPIPELIAGIIQYFVADTDKERKRAASRIKYGLKFWIPFSGFMRDANRLLSGEYDISDFLFYKTKEE